MLEYKNVELIDREWINPLLRLSDFRGSEYCFTNIFAWRDVYDTQISRWKDFLLLRIDSKTVPAEIYPAGEGDIKELMELLFDAALQEKRDFRMSAVASEQATLLMQLYPGLFEVTPTRDNWDYIYQVEDLCLLKGRRYQPKRNHLSHFLALPDWGYEPVTAQNIDECIKMNTMWCQQLGCTQNSSRYEESCIAEMELRYFDSLGLEGALLRVEGRVVAYTLGEPLNSDTYTIHIEKAFPEYKGAYQMINREFLRSKGASYLYVNREEDLDDQGLRKAKLSYHPAFMLEKYSFVVPYKSLVHLSSNIIK